MAGKLDPDEEPLPPEDAEVSGLKQGGAIFLMSIRKSSAQWLPTLNRPISAALELLLYENV